MKELSIEEKAKAYDEALERARELVGKWTGKNKDFYIEDYSYIFPELKESEDERIRKAIFKALSKKAARDVLLANGIQVSDALAWLEKQDNTDIEQVFRPLAGCCIDTAAEQAVELQKQGKNVVLAFNGCYIPVKNNTTDAIVNEYYSWLEKRGEQKPTDKSEPKFKVGDWITNNYAVWCIESIHNGLYSLKNSNGGVISNSNPKAIDNNFHLWTIQDAKEGDVLVAPSRTIFMFKNIIDNMPYSYCGIDYTGRFRNTILEGGKDGRNWTSSLQGIYPATKEQCDLLFQKMKEAGYEWDAEKKELKKTDDKK